LHITGLLPEILDVLDSFGFRMGKVRISLLLILQGLVAIAATLLIAMWLGRILESRLMRTEQMDMNLRVILSKLVRALLIFVGVLIALPVAGIDLTVLSVFGGALGVGLGFGLQKIASNYVSGFIILADRSIRLGDVVTIDNRHGVISRLGTRYTVVRAMDGTEALIPNETLVTSTVVNHSFSNREVLARLTLQISYQSPLEAAMTIMADAARAQPRVLRKPEPQAILKSFADNGIELELNFWIADPEEGAGSLKSAIQLEIWREFQRAGIGIPYPQRDIRIISGKPGQASGAGLAP
ncbi:MAG: mechanosensitive ion channel domain-containing protein, partial [Pseudomonadota bacterium]